MGYIVYFGKMYPLLSKYILCTRFNVKTYKLLFEVVELNNNNTLQQI